MTAPPAATITVRDTLAMLDGPKRNIAEGVADDRYVFWLGSGISRERLPDLRDIAKKVLIGLQARLDHNDQNCRFLRALRMVLDLTQPSPEEWERIDYTIQPHNWPDFDVLAARLVNNYARMLNISIGGENQDYILWEVLDAPNVYANEDIDPDAEHLCLAALALEGVASDMPSANWDFLVERAVKLLSGGRPVLRVVVAPEDVRGGRLRSNLYKFHGCAKKALEDEAQFRELLVARSSQIHGWVARNPVMSQFLTNLIVSKPTIMLGLSAQDSNIQALFAAAEATMTWPWPSNPPAYAFSENALGVDQEGLLQNVYHQHIDATNKAKMEEEALIQAYAKPLLLSLLLYTLAAKLKSLVSVCAPGLAAEDRAKLIEGLDYGRNLIADHLAPNAEVVTELLIQWGRTMTMLRNGTLPMAINGIYEPVTTEPLMRMLADPNLASSGMCQFAVALGIIGQGLARGLWTAAKADIDSNSSGAVVLNGRSGPAKIYFAANARSAIQLRLNGLIAENDDAVIVHSHENVQPMPRFPRRAPGRTGLATVREISIEDLLADGTETEDMLARFRSRVAL